ncbi:MAG TPA: hypothetical protein ENH59_00270 [Bacteroidetes bacterium]|nr:hypothetical protein [Bacteroidota bacterium]
MKNFQYRYILIIALMLMIFNKGYGQRPLPDELLTNTIEGQINYIEEHTRIYENYRAIREDMFQKVNSNIMDSLAAYRNEIADLNIHISSLNKANDSLKNSLEDTTSDLQEVTRTKHNISLFGLEINKIVYNLIMLTIIAALIILLVMGFALFKRNRFITNKTKEDLKDLNDEFEEYRQSSRRAREKMTMEHFKEIQKLKGG